MTVKLSHYGVKWEWERVVKTLQDVMAITQELISTEEEHCCGLQGIAEQHVEGTGMENGRFWFPWNLHGIPRNSVEIYEWILGFWDWIWVRVRRSGSDSSTAAALAANARTAEIKVWQVPLHYLYCSLLPWGRAMTPCSFIYHMVIWRDFTSWILHLKMLFPVWRHNWWSSWHWGWCSTSLGLDLMHQVKQSTSGAWWAEWFIAFNETFNSKQYCRDMFIPFPVCLLHTSVNYPLPHCHPQQ